ncbi:MAG: hypothetical protein H0X24_11845 [Ktedonobacterales bacterium]|nr:hypothetical protein [Ktedonobacterales bacterium]
MLTFVAIIIACLLLICGAVVMRRMAQRFTAMLQRHDAQVVEDITLMTDLVNAATKQREDIDALLGELCGAIADYNIAAVEAQGQLTQLRIAERRQIRPYVLPSDHGPEMLWPLPPRLYISADELN